MTRLLAWEKEEEEKKPRTPPWWLEPIRPLTPPTPRPPPSPTPPPEEASKKQMWLELLDQIEEDIKEVAALEQLEAAVEGRQIEVTIVAL